MFREQYKADNEHIEPNQELLDSLATKMKNYDQEEDRIKQIAKKHGFSHSITRYKTVLACSLLLIVTISTYAFTHRPSKISDSNIVAEQSTNDKSVENFTAIAPSNETDSDESKQELKIESDDTLKDSKIEDGSLKSTPKESLEKSSSNSDKLDSSMKSFGTNQTNNVFVNIDNSTISSIKMTLPSNRDKVSITDSSKITSAVTTIQSLVLLEEVKDMNQDITEIISINILHSDHSQEKLTLYNSYICFNGTYYTATKESVASVVKVLKEIKNN